MPPSVLFLNLNAAHTPDKEIWIRRYEATYPKPLPRPPRWDGQRPPLSAAKVRAKASSKQIFDIFLLVIFKNVYEHTSLTPLANTVRKECLGPKLIAQNLSSSNYIIQNSEIVFVYE